MNLINDGTIENLINTNIFQTLNNNLNACGIKSFTVTFIIPTRAQKNNFLI